MRHQRYLTGNLPLAYGDVTIECIEGNWRTLFEKEVESGNFLLGGKSLILVGDNADHVARQWLACLIRANYSAYRVTPMELARRALTYPIVNDSDERAADFDRAECLLLDDFFDKPIDDLTDAFSWYFRELIRDGVVILIASNKVDADLDNWGSIAGNEIAKNFEAIHGEKIKTTRKKAKSDG